MRVWTRQDSRYLPQIRSLPPHPEVRENLQRLRRLGSGCSRWRTRPLGGVKAQLQNADLADYFKESVSVDSMRAIQASFGRVSQLRRSPEGAAQNHPSCGRSRLGCLGCPAGGGGQLPLWHLLKLTRLYLVLEHPGARRRTDPSLRECDLWVLIAFPPAPPERRRQVN